MSEVKDRVKKREIVNEYLLQMFQKKFEELASTCRDGIVAAGCDPICTYHESGPTDCRFSICPKLDLSLDVAADYLAKTEGRYT